MVNDFRGNSIQLKKYYYIISSPMSGTGVMPGDFFPARKFPPYPWSGEYSIKIASAIFLFPDRKLGHSFGCIQSPILSFSVPPCHTEMHVWPPRFHVPLISCYYANGILPDWDPAMELPESWFCSRLGYCWQFEYNVSLSDSRFCSHQISLHYNIPNRQPICGCREAGGQL